MVSHSRYKQIWFGTPTYLTPRSLLALEDNIMNYFSVKRYTFAINISGEGWISIEERPDLNELYVLAITYLNFHHHQFWVRLGKNHLSVTLCTYYWITLFLYFIFFGIARRTQEFLCEFNFKIHLGKERNCEIES